ncbi:MAG: MBL fold metallo-hydrolase [Candidatus Aminicenantes bacterium]|nr:MBL fold metallo-hydrolase [Candidatus Aminicenantes bacterium]
MSKERFAPRSRLFAAFLAMVAPMILGFQALQAQAAPPAKQAAPQTPSMTTQHIAGGLYLVKGGSGANTAFYVGEKGVIAIDAKMTADAAKQMLAEITKVTTLPVIMILITHSDGDHINGLTGFPEGLDIISSEGAKKEMIEAFKSENFAGHRRYLPTKTFKDPFTILPPMPDGNSALIMMYHFGPAHTSGDAVIVFTDEKTAFVGDLVFIGRDPLIHRQKGGTVFGYLDTLKKLIDLKDVETYLSGHADPQTKADLRALLTTLEEKAAKVKAMVAEGKTLDEVKAAFGLQPAAGSQPSRWPSFVENIYLELAGKKK